MKANKFILIDGELIFGNVEFHLELIPKSKANTVRPSGGGRFFWNQKTDVVLIYGNSSDFGSVSKDDFIAAWKKSLISPFWENKIIHFSREVWQSSAMEHFEDITELLKS